MESNSYQEVKQENLDFVHQHFYYAEVLEFLKFKRHNSVSDENIIIEISNVLTRGQYFDVYNCFLCFKKVYWIYLII